MNYIKSLKVNYSLSAVICVILGIVLLVWPGQSTQVVCMVLGIVLGGFGLRLFCIWQQRKKRWFPTA